MRAVSKFTLALLLIGTAFLLLCAMPDGADARTATWDGGGADNLASTAANWDLDAPPVTGDDLLINAGNKAISWNMANNSFNSITITAGYTGTITQASHFYVITWNQSGGVYTPSTSYFIYLYGDFTKSAGTFNGNGRFIFMDDCVFTNGASTNTGYLENRANLTLVGSVYIGEFGYTFKNSGTINVTAGKGLYINHYNTEVVTFQNTGRIYGGGVFQFALKGQSPTVTFGNFDVVSTITLYSGGTASRAVKLGGDSTFKALAVMSGHGTYTCALDVNDHNLTAPSLTIGPRGVLICGNGTIATSMLDSENGELTGENAIWVLDEWSNITLGAAHQLYDVRVNGHNLCLNTETNITGNLSFIWLIPGRTYETTSNGTVLGEYLSDPLGIIALGPDVYEIGNITLEIVPLAPPAPPVQAPTLSETIAEMAAIVIGLLLLAGVIGLISNGMLSMKKKLK